MTDYNGKTVMPGMPGYDPNLDTGARGAMYYPTVSRAKAAKELYFMWVLAQPLQMENDADATVSPASGAADL